MDVQGLWIQHSNVAYFPLGIENFFPNLVAISISNSNLKRITKEDLKPFPNLRYFSLWSNHLQTVEKDLFQYNPKLEVIILKENRISQIEPTVFDNFVDKLRYFYLDGNNCQFGDAYDDKQKANEMIAQIQDGSCKNDDLKKIIEELAMKVEAGLKAQEMLTEKLNAQMKTELQRLQTQLNENCQCEKLEKRIKFIENAVGVDGRP